MSAVDPTAPLHAHPLAVATVPAAVVCVGVSWWNRPTLKALWTADGAQVAFVETVGEGIERARASGARLHVWASRLTGADRARAASVGVGLVAVEDGFVRSVGLGAGLARGGAYVFDHRGIYYDATAPSDLEVMLEAGCVGGDERARARDLGAAIVEARVSKYNVGRQRAAIAYPHGRERVLVVGQVSGDAGVRRTVSRTIDVATPETVNRDLLRAARTEFPKAFIVYKPHPDVATGLRAGAVDARDLAQCADAVVADADVVGLIETADRVVTLSSLSGFEALLRGRPVTVHGLPFYAGWGLTDDHTSSPRRTRRLDLETLIDAALVRYCRYVDPVRLCPAAAEDMVRVLSRQRRNRVHRLATHARRQVSWVGRKLGF